MTTPIARSFKIWFFTDLLGSLFFLLVFPEKGSLDFNTFVEVCIYGGVFSSPSLLISTLAIGRLKTLREETLVRLGFMTGITTAIIVLVLLLFDKAFGRLANEIAGPFGLVRLMYPYCITALVMSLYFTRDLVFIHHEETTFPQQHNTEI